MTSTDQLDRVAEQLAACADPAAVASLSADEARAVMGAALVAVRRAEALHVLLAAHFARLGAFRADGAVDTAAWLRTVSRMSGRAARQVAEAADAANTSADIAARLAAGTLTVEHAAAMAALALRESARAAREKLEEQARERERAAREQGEAADGADAAGAGAENAAGAGADAAGAGADGDGAASAGASGAAEEDASSMGSLFQHADESPDAFRKRVTEHELRTSEDGGNDRARRQRERSELREFLGEDGTLVFRSVLDPERHAIVRTAVEAVMLELWRRANPAGTRPPTKALPKLRVDALAEICRRSLAGVRGGTNAPISVGVSDGGTARTIVHIDHATLVDGIRRVDSICRLDDGTPIAVETARRIACESEILPLVLNGRSEPLDLGRAERLASAEQRIALAVRSSTCEFFGCDVPAAFSRVHHLQWWDHGGPTDLDSMCACCERHHHFVHEGGWALERIDGVTYTRRPDGMYLGLSPPAVT